MKTVTHHGVLEGGTAAVLLTLLLTLAILCPSRVSGQAYGEPDRGAPGDVMIQEYLRQATEKMEADFLGEIKTAEDWHQARPRLKQEYFDMLGLWPLPEKTSLHATVTRTLDRGDYLVEMVHYQSRPGLYVTGNLYRPSKLAPGSRLPAVLYVCGHSPRPRDGNKTAYQSHGIWFARHGYICLVLDTLEMGEITCTHHGTYREGRWWWLSRGYTPAGVECWNGVRGVDYLASLPFVDSERIGVTGISGGGAATHWIAAADERTRIAVPVSGWSDLLAHVPNRVVNGHCDCMFNYNIYQWPYARVPAMMAPRPFLFVNSDADPIFPMDGNERILNRLERLYSLFGAGDLVDAVVSVGGHAYRKDIRQAAFRFFNTHLKDDARPITDSEVDLVINDRPEAHPIPPEQLRVFPQDSDLPPSSLNERIDYEFVPLAKPELPAEGQFEAWKEQRLTRMRQLSFHHFPQRIPAASALSDDGVNGVRLITEPGISIRMKTVRLPPGAPKRIGLYVASTDLHESPPSWLSETFRQDDAVYILEPRGIGGTRWTAKNPPNYVERSHYLLGRTADSGRVWDVAAAARYLHALHRGQTEVHAAGEGPGAVLAAYGALIEPEIAGLLLSRVPTSHMEPTAPQFLGILRVLDIPQAIGMLAPRPVVMFRAKSECAQPAAELYRLAGTSDRFQLRQ